ncbi:spore germination lipoprotein GerD [Bacillus ndiopicus]|uniref:spore germination lipoprotein GerD n=1 Tax=Bacillus ndiopicus TaxID=1347368 RepID=UPI0005A6DC23|nr:spore germination lipoprotein GerD [Bacillus ndiopicus]
MYRIGLIIFSVILLAGCTESKSATLSYDEVKKIMVDSIQTEDGKKAIRQILEDPKFRELLVLDSDEVKQATEKTLLSKEAEEFWKKTFQDPKFKEAIAKSMQEQQETILKGLMKDASYQEDLQSFFGQTEMQKQLETILKSAPLRKQMEQIVMDTIDNPLLQSKWQQLIIQNGEISSSGDSESKKSKDDSKDKSNEEQKQ